MNRKTQDAIMLSRVAVDIVMVTLGWIIAYKLRFSGLLPISKGIPQAMLYFKLIPFICAIWFFAFGASGFYRRTGRHRSAFVEALDVIQCCAIATLAFIAFTYVYAEYRYSRVVLFLFAGIHPWLVIAGRSIIRKSLRRYRARATARRVLLIGSGECLNQAIELASLDDLVRGDLMGAVLVGDDPSQRTAAVRCAHRGIPVLARPLRPVDWIDFFTKNPVDSVIIALPHRAADFLETDLETIADQVPDVKFVPDLTRFTRFATGVELVHGVPVVSVHESPLAGMGSILKRVVDIAGALAAIIVFSPLMILVAVVVRATSRGPILYKQERMGLDGKTFMCLKFRSMPIDAEKTTGAVWAKAGDQRATPLGAFLRKTSLDEFPQFFNVLRGDMSLVGPRPERPVFVEQFRRDVPGYYLRHKTKAGITGWAQVNGWRGNTSIEKRIECDLYYIQHWSLIFDLKIILLTLVYGFVNKNAY